MIDSLRTFPSTLARFVTLADIAWTGLKLRCHAKDTKRRERAQNALANRLGESRGIAMKVGQTLADRAAPSSYDSLLSDARPYPLKTMRRVLEKSLGCSAEQIFSQLDEATAAASLGQVHHATLRDGTEVAVKIRYPRIDRAVQAELKLAGLMPGIGPVRRWGFNIESYKRVLNANMTRELNYLDEADRQIDYRAKNQIAGLVVPRVYRQWCRKQVLVQDWHTGARIDTVAGWSKKNRLLIARTLLMTLFNSLFKSGNLHADPHSGNYFFRHDNAGVPQVVLLDFGCTVGLDATRRRALASLILALRERRPIAPIEYFAALGFEEKKLVYINDALPALCDILFAPFLVDRAFRIDEWQIKAPMAKLLGDQRWWFRAAGPAELFLVLRALQGMAHQLQKLDAALPWWPLLQQACGERCLAQARTWTPPPLKVAGQMRRLNVEARNLHIRVEQNATPIVALSMPAEAALDLTTIIPPEVRSRIDTKTGLNVNELSAKLRRSGIVPQQLVDFKDKEKSYRVWLE